MCIYIYIWPTIYIYMTWVVKTYEDLPELMAIDCNVKNDDTPFAFGMLYFQICIHKYIHIYNVYVARKYGLRR